MARPDALIDEVANELATWPGVRIERRADGAAIAEYHGHELGILREDDDTVELPFLGAERDELIEHGDAEPATDGGGVIHELRGPSDLTAVLGLLDQRYRDLRGEGPPYASQDPR